MAAELERKAAIGVVWSLIERFGAQGIRFATAVILARKLVPADFGLIGMITVFFAVAQVIIQSGFSQAYIQQKEVSDIDANTVFYTNLMLSLVLYAGLYMAAPFIANFYNQSALISLTRVMGLIVIINSLGVIQIAQLMRQIDFKRMTKITLSSSLLSGGVGIIAAYRGLGVWALVVQHILQATLLVAGLWVTSRWKPAWVFSTASLKRLFAFGFWILAGNLVRTVFDNIYILTIGKLFPVAQLGFYTKAKQFQRLSTEQITKSVGLVSFPVLARIQKDNAAVQAVMRKFLQHTLFFLVPLLVTLIVVAKPLILLLLTPKWAPMVPYLQLLCIIGFLMPIHQINIQVIKAKGNSRLNFNINLLKSFLRIMNIYVMHRYSIAHIIAGEILVSFIALFINTYFAHSMIGYGFRRQFKDVWIIYISGAASGLAGFLASSGVDNSYLELMLGAVITVTLYFCCQYVLNKTFIYEIINIKKAFR
ncbi:MAG: lipopolysaccharide biosynthesis protein [Nitrospinales bacterium]